MPKAKVVGTAAPKESVRELPNTAGVDANGFDPFADAPNWEGVGFEGAVPAVVVPLPKEKPEAAKGVGLVSIGAVASGAVLGGVAPPKGKPEAPNGGVGLVNIGAVVFVVAGLVNWNEVPTLLSGNGELPKEKGAELPGVVSGFLSLLGFVNEKPMVDDESFSVPAFDPKSKVIAGFSVTSETGVCASEKEVPLKDEPVAPPAPKENPPAADSLPVGMLASEPPKEKPLLLASVLKEKPVASPILGVSTVLAPKLNPSEDLLTEESAALESLRGVLPLLESVPKEKPVSPPLPEESTVTAPKLNPLAKGLLVEESSPLERVGEVPPVFDPLLKEKPLPPVLTEVLLSADPPKENPLPFAPNENPPAVGFVSVSNLEGVSSETEDFSFRVVVDPKETVPGVKEPNAIGLGVTFSGLSAESAFFSFKT